MANANRTLIEILREEVAQGKQARWTWAAIMGRALYEPEVGYYRHRIPEIGRKGDFYTSVSVGNVFGEILAAFIFDRWISRGSPKPFYLIEQGAHEATLAKDILQALSHCDSEIGKSVEYVIVEPDQQLRARQEQVLSTVPYVRAHHLSDLGELKKFGSLQGIFLTNELLDAFPVHQVRFENSQWREAYVECSPEGALTWFYGDLSSPEVEAACQDLGRDYPEGYTTEIHLAPTPWLQEIADTGFVGEVLIFDYGYTETEYYSPDRVNGTLRRYYQHKTDREVLEDLGQCDLTAHVNFTSVAREAEKLGMGVFEFIEQGRFLSQIATRLILRPESPPDPSWVRQFMTLTHPSHLGHSFRVLGLSHPSSDSSLLPSLPIVKERVGLGSDA